MKFLELKTIAQRKRILKVIRDKFGGSVRSQAEITIAICGHRTSPSVRNDLNWLVEHGYLTLSRPGGSTKAYTLTEKFT